ncbi:acyl-CoA-binding domain-containing protein 1-like [Wolffia australiana]
MGDWRELVQATFIGLVFAFLVAKLISTVLSFRDENLKIVRSRDLPAETPIAVADSSDSSGGDHLPPDLAAEIGEPKNSIDNADRVEDKEVVDDEDEDDDEWEGIESTELDEIFSAATAFVAATAADRSTPNVSNDLQLQLYGLYKIATEGPCTAPQPSPLKMTARAKWTAWQKLGAMPPEEAMQKYITIVTELYPTWTAGCGLASRSQGEVDSKQSSGSASGGTMGPVFSSFIHEEENNTHVDLDPLHVSAREGDVHALRARLEDGFSVNTIDSEGRTPLHWAVDRGRLDVVEMLLDRNANVNAKDNEGQTPLHYACLCDRAAIAEELIRRGADRGAKDKDGQTPGDL